MDGWQDHPDPSTGRRISQEGRVCAGEYHYPYAGGTGYRSLLRFFCCYGKNKKDRILYGRSCLPGKFCKNASLPEQMLHDLMKQVDYALIEADGAKHYALKYPSEQEPVIPEGTTDVILVLGSWDLGKPCNGVVFRFEHMTSALGISGDMKADKQMLQWIWQAYEEKLKNMDYQGHFHVLLSKRQIRGLCFTHWRNERGYMNKEILIICRGGGDLATGIVHRLFRAGYQVLILETAEPAAIRRQVSFAKLSMRERQPWKESLLRESTQPKSRRWKKCFKEDVYRFWWIRMDDQ